MELGPEEGKAFVLNCRDKLEPLLVRVHRERSPLLVQTVPEPQSACCSLSGLPCEVLSGEAPMMEVDGDGQAGHLLQQDGVPGRGLTQQGALLPPGQQLQR